MDINETMVKKDEKTFYGIGIDNKIFYKDYVLICPICGFHNSHLGIEKPDKYHYDTEGNYKNWKGYGSRAIEINGECGHNWLITFNSYEGSVYVETEILPNTLYEEHDYEDE